MQAHTIPAAPVLTAPELFSEAMSRVESSSIRDWASSAHNRPIFLRIAEGWIAKHAARYSRADAASRFATFVMTEAIGL